MKFKKAVAVILAASFIASCGCKAQEEEFDPDEVRDAMEDVTEAFLQALADNDRDAVAELVPDFDYDRELARILDSEDIVQSIGFDMISRAEVEFDDEPEIHAEDGFALIDVEITYISPMEVVNALHTDFPSYDDYMEVLNSSSVRCEVSKKFRFDYDEDEDEWCLTETSAHKMAKLFTDEFNRFNNIPNLTNLAAMELFNQYLNDLAQYGSSDIPNNYDISEWCRGYYDNITQAGEGPEVDAAFNDFVMAYMTFVVTHDCTTSEYDGPYILRFDGVAPSREDLLASLETDEFLTQYYMNYLRAEYLGMSEEDMWNAQTVLLYETLAEAVPDCGTEGYYFLCEVGPWDGVLYMSEDIITYPDRGLYEVEHSVGWEQMQHCYQAAIDTLCASGEISRDLRDQFLAELTPENYGFGSDTDTVSPSGHPNQAVGTYEQVPSWCTDGSIVYGYSNLDPNGYWMHYSKEPGWLDTVSYYVDDDGIWITCYYDCTFDAGTTLIVDWWVDDEQVIDTQMVNIRADGTDEVEVFLPVDSLSGSHVYEMRLWEDDHSHVIAYVTLTHEA